MRFAVAVKQVPDTMEMSVDENGSLVRAGVPSILNPYDECALSRVLELRREGDEVVVFTMGPPQARQALERCLEMGADRAYLLTDRDFAGADRICLMYRNGGFIAFDRRLGIQKDAG